jgi:DSF synthase
MQTIVEFPMLPAAKVYTQLELQYDLELKTLFSWMKPKQRPCFTATLLEEVQHFEKQIEANAGHINHCGRPERVAYLVAGSKATGAFNLGGDLGMFIQAIMRQDRQILDYYAHLCIDNIYRRLSGLGGNIPTIALVQGKALGGGFECALTSDVIVAERSASFSFPEIMFNLIPGMGALPLLKRRVGFKKAEDIIMSGHIFSAKELHDLGVVEILVEDGLGFETVRCYIRQRQKKSVAYRALFQAKQICDPITKEDLLAVVDLWVDAALQLETRDLRMMALLLRGQDRMVTATNDDADLEGLYEAAPLAAVGGGD